MGELASSDFFDWAGTAFFLYYFFIRAFARSRETDFAGLRWSTFLESAVICLTAHTPEPDTPGPGELYKI